MEYYFLILRIKIGKNLTIKDFFLKSDTNGMKTKKLLKKYQRKSILKF